VASRHQIPFRAFLWEYLGYPDDETPERKRILYAIVVLRLGFGLFFLLRGWSAVFAAPPDAFATRLGDPVRLGLGGAAVDTTLFILGCTELGVGALLLFGAFTRVSAVTGIVLILLYLILGDRSSFDVCARPEPQFQDACGRASAWLGDAPAPVTALFVVYLAGLAVIVIAGSPFLSADRALDKLEEEERDRAPAVLPKLAEYSRAILCAGILIAGLWLTARNVLASRESGIAWMLLIAGLDLLILALVCFVPFAAILGASGLLFRMINLGDMRLAMLILPSLFIAIALPLLTPPTRSYFVRMRSRARLRKPKDENPLR
jgi:uncharacterized membrane protein YphA (DoxX/SURF4 family)